MTKEQKIHERKARRSHRTRAKIFGTATKPRLAVFRSNRGIYVQLIDDEHMKTLSSARAIKKAKEKASSKSDQAGTVGTKIAETALKAGIKEAIFDRRSYQYHGRVKAVAEAARKAGLKI